MPTLHESAIASQLTLLKSVNGVSVIYARPSTGESLSDLTVIPARSRFEHESDYDRLVTELEIEDFLIEPADLVLGSSTVEPAQGDTITIVRGEQTLTYQLLPPGGAEPAWRWSDPGRTRIRVHTKLIEEA